MATSFETTSGGGRMLRVLRRGVACMRSGDVGVGRITQQLRRCARLLHTCRGSSTGGRAVDAEGRKATLQRWRRMNNEVRSLVLDCVAQGDWEEAAVHVMEALATRRLTLVELVELALHRLHHPLLPALLFYSPRHLQQQLVVRLLEQVVPGDEAGKLIKNSGQDGLLLLEPLLYTVEERQRLFHGGAERFKALENSMHVAVDHLIAGAARGQLVARHHNAVQRSLQRLAQRCDLQSALLQVCDVGGSRLLVS
mmetsp:Transcript_9842/g.17141  ORF Transcript_9842/g.17141 Transcript_9842/m.17141 type:complete len:253 (-) Transcript_9842:347-1105(-)